MIVMVGLREQQGVGRAENALVEHSCQMHTVTHYNSTDESCVRKLSVQYCILLCK